MNTEDLTKDQIAELQQAIDEAAATAVEKDRERIAKKIQGLYSTPSRFNGAIGHSFYNKAIRDAQACIDPAVDELAERQKQGAMA